LVRAVLAASSAPGMVIGAFVGAAVWRLLEPSCRVSATTPPVRHCRDDGLLREHLAGPLAVMLMVAEMTGTLSLIVPAMLAVGLATLIVARNDDTIYRSQLRSRAESLRTVSSPVFHCSRSRLRHRRWPRHDVCWPSPADSAKFQAQMEHDEVSAAPLSTRRSLRGVVTLEALEK